MKKMKRILAILLATALIFSLFGCSGKKDSSTTDETTTAGQEETTTAADKETDGDEEETTTAGSSGEAAEITINLHYLREDGNYEGWNVWFWAVGADGGAFYFGDEVGDKGAVTTAKFPAGTTEIGYIVRLNEWESKDVDKDQFIDASVTLAGTINVFVKSGVEGYEFELGDDCVAGVGVSSATMSDDYKTVTVNVTQELKDETLTIKDADGKELKVESQNADGKKITMVLAEAVDPFGSYVVEVNGELQYAISVPDILSTQGFEDEYAYDGDDLGAVWSKDSTTFKVWAPTANSVKVNLYKSGTQGTDDLIKAVDMTKGDKGVWSVKVDGDLNGTYYTYTVKTATEENEACDPYAHAVGVNGNRAMVIDLDSTDPEGWDKDKNPNSGMDATDSIIYELHIRDVSADKSSGIKNVGKYLGLTEVGTKNSKGAPTGISHMVDLGITHVQLTPVYDYATVDESKLDKPQYNWGYDPKNYNVPEGSYSTDPYNGEVRVKEFKQMVQALHNNGISVVMDVVYNHTYTADYCFNKIVPGYFHRPGSNGSGCGNDVASERAMVRKFIVDSCVYWVTEYHIDGFRFDLVGLIDTQTINEIRAELDKIDPSIILYGEGWTMGTVLTKDKVTLATQTNSKQIPGFGLFSDTIRDAIKGSVFEATAKGYVNGDTSKTSTIKAAVTGSTPWSKVPSQQIVYASCHDNYTLWDEINASNADDSMEDKIKQNLMSAAIVYTAQGVPFIFAGEELLRSKPNGDGTFNHNSYNTNDEMNSIKWDNLNDAATQKVYNYYKGLIAFRKAHASMTQMNTCTDCYTFVDGLPTGVLAYTLAPADGEVSEGIFVVYNPTKEAVKVDLPAGDWTICVQGDKAGTESLGTASGSISVDAITTTVLVKGALK